MRRLIILALAALGLAPSANAAECTLALGTVRGPAPLAVHYAVTCDTAVTARWSFGDAAAADGTAVQHTFAAGAWGQALDVTAADGTVLHYDLVHAVAYQLAVGGPRRARYGQRVFLQGKLYPALPGRVTIAGRRAHFIAPGVFRLGFRITRPGPYVARFEGASSKPDWILLRPRLDVRVEGSRTVGSRLRVVAVLHPAHAGTVRVKVDGRHTTRIPTGRPHTARLVVSTLPRKGWAGPSHIERVAIVAPSLGVGSHGESVRELERQLTARHYALRGIDGLYGTDDLEAVYAFQKVHGLARTGAVDGGVWSQLLHSGVPPARYGGSDHLEVDKTRQVLFVVRGGKVARVVHVSTGATGNTPLGAWHVYSKVPGWSWVLWYPSFFLRGFAIHGYPDVPPYPASHGCVRVPMWIAPQLYADAPFGSTVMVYQ